MQKYFGTVVDTKGKPLSGASVAVRLAGTETLATIYADDEATPLSNPITTGSGVDAGEFEFKAANALYDLYITGSGISAETIEDVLLFDFDDISLTDLITDLAAAGLDARYSRMDAKSDGWGWWRHDATGTDASVEVTAQSTGRIMNLRQGAGDGSVVAYFDNSGNLILPGDPSSALMAATKQYVDLLAAGMDPKGSVRAATTANITLSGAQTIDGVSVIAGDRVLVKDQSTGAENGIYTAAAGAWSRSSDANTSAEVTSGMFCFVTEGTTNGNTGWLLTTDDPITLNTTVLTFVQFSTVGAYTDEAAQDAVGNILADSTEFDWTYDDVTPQITLALKAASIAWAKVANIATSRILGRTTASSGSVEELTVGSGLNLSGGSLALATANNPVGKHLIPLPATAWYPRTTNGCAALAQAESATNRVNYKYLAFDGAAIEYAQFAMPMPSGWNEGTVSARFIAAAASGSGDVIWGIQAIALSDADTIDTAMGTAVEVTDTYPNATTVRRSSETGAMTVGGSPAAGDWVVFQVYRKATDAGDTLNSIDAHLIAVELFITTNEATDG